MVHAPVAVAIAAAFTLAAAGAPPEIGDPFPPTLPVPCASGRMPAFADPSRPSLVAFVKLGDTASRRTLPALNAAARRFSKEVAVVVIAEEPESAVRDFASSPDWSDRIAFAVAGDPRRAAVQTVFGRGAVPRLPTALVVRGGTVLWQGMPDDAEEVLAEVLAGRWDLATARRAAEQQRLWDEEVAKVEALAAAGRHDDALAALDSTCRSALPSQAASCPARRFELLVGAGRGADAAAVGEQVLAAPGGDRRGAGMAWTIARRIPGDKAALAFALRAADRADRAAGGTDSMVAGVLARVQFLSGDRAAAAATVRRAIQHASTPDERRSLEQDLGVYGPAATPPRSP
jgi:hypothetical protein